MEVLSEKNLKHRFVKCNRTHLTTFQSVQEIEKSPLMNIMNMSMQDYPFLKRHKNWYIIFLLIYFSDSIAHLFISVILYNRNIQICNKIALRILFTAGNRPIKFFGFEVIFSGFLLLILISRTWIFSCSFFGLFSTILLVLLNVQNCVHVYQR